MTLADLVAQAVAGSAAGLHVSVPGVVQSYDSAAQTVDVLPSVGADEPIIPQVPVMFPAAGGYALTLPVTAGDRVVLVFADRSLDEWWTGRDGVAPADARTHARTDCYALLGGRPSDVSLAHVDTSRAVLGPVDSTSPRVAVASGTVHLGVAHATAGTQSVVRGEAHLSALDTLLSALDTLLTTGANGGGPVVFAGLAAWATARSTFAAAQHTTSTVKVP